MIYVYAIVDNVSFVVEGLTGLRGAPLACISQGPVAAICSIQENLEVDADVDSLWQHEQVTAALMRRCSVAPVRFGTMFADEDQLRGMLTVQGQRLGSVLAQLRGKVELALRASDNRLGRCAPVGRVGTLDPGPLDRPATSGQMYLRSLRDEYPGEPSVAVPGSLSDLHAALATRAAASALQVRPPHSIMAAYLVEAGDVRSFRHAFVSARRGHVHVRASLTGPWAPFSFVEDGASAHV